MVRFLVISLGCLFGLFSCQSTQSKKSFRIAFSQCIGSDAWRETMLKEMRRELSFHPEVEFLYTDAEGSNEKQISQIRDLAAQKIDLLIVSPNEAEPLTAIVDSIFKEKIPVIVTDRKTASGLYNAYVGANNKAIGAMAAQYMVNILPDNSRVGIITGLSRTSASIEREQGFREVLKNNPTIKLTTAYSGNWLKNVAEDIIKDNIQEFKSLDALFAFNDQMALGAIQQLKTNSGNPDLKIIGVDALPGANNGLEQILKGRMDASLLYPTGGSECIKTAMAILNKAQYERENILKTSVIDAGNAALLNLQYEKIDDQQQDIDRQQELLSDQRKIYNDQKMTLNILVTSLVLAIVFGGIAIIALKSNWEKNKRLERNNDEIIKQQKQLIEMSNQIKTTADARSNFFTKISHEFKTPLTLISTPLEDLLNDKSLSADIVNQLQRMKRNSDKLLNLINELLEIQKISQDKIKLRASSQNIDKFIGQIIQSFKPLSTKKKIAISYTNFSTCHSLWFDTNLMEKVFNNLISNALKHTEKHEKIDIKTELNNFGDHLLIRIIDNGKGIAREHVDHIFEPFYQGTHSIDGSGVGLALVREIVTIHHGQITVSSKENEGSAFTLRLPIGDHHLSEEEKAAVLLPVSTDKENSLNKIQATINQGGYTTEKKVIHKGHTHTILIVDDHYDVVDFLSEKLQQHYNIFTCSSAEEAFGIATKNSPDIIISDIMMPGKSGLDLLRLLKNDSRTSFIPVVLLSAADSDEHKILAAQEMADAYITKPFRLERLLATTGNLIKGRQTLKNRFQSEVEIPHHVDTGKNLSDIDRAFINNFSAIVESSLSDPKLSVEEIASRLNLSRIQLYRKVKSLANCGVNDYVLNRRLKKAKHLILEGYNINEIADKVGFSSSTYFATSFKKAYGLTPSNFRKKHLK